MSETLVQSRFNVIEKKCFKNSCNSTSSNSAEYIFLKESLEGRQKASPHTSFFLHSIKVSRYFSSCSISHPKNIYLQYASLHWLSQQSVSAVVVVSFNLSNVPVYLNTLWKEHHQLLSAISSGMLKKSGTLFGCSIHETQKKSAVLFLMNTLIFRWHFCNVTITAL